MSARALVKDLVVERPRRIFRRCTFCGAPCHGEACASHRDLLAKDPHHIATRQRRH